LIPEDWFIKQSAFTGQETYFPRERVLTRVQAILSMKDSHSLDEMAQFFSPDPQNTTPASDLQDFTALNSQLLELLQMGNDGKDSYETGEVVFLTALSKFVEDNTLECSQAAVLARSALAAASKSTPASKCVLVRPKARGAELYVVFGDAAGTPLFDDEIEVVGTLALQEAAEAFGSYLAKQ
jgi:hypothetical protein